MVLVLASPAWAASTADAPLAGAGTAVGGRVLPAAGRLSTCRRAISRGGTAIVGPCGGEACHCCATGEQSAATARGGHGALAGGGARPPGAARCPHQPGAPSR